MELMWNVERNNENLAVMMMIMMGMIVMFNFIENSNKLGSLSRTLDTDLILVLFPNYIAIFYESSLNLEVFHYN